MSERAPLESLLRLRRDALEQAKGELGRCTRARRDAEEAARASNARAACAAPLSGSSDHWQLLDLARERLQREAREAERRSADLLRHEQEAAQRVVAALSEARALERLVDARRGERRRTIAKREQAELDAVGARRGPSDR